MFRHIPFPKKLKTKAKRNEKTIFTFSNSLHLSAKRGQPPDT